MPRKIRELKSDPGRAGFQDRPGKGRHTVWESDVVPETATLSGHDGDDAKPYQEKDLRRLLGLVESARKGQK